MTPEEVASAAAYLKDTLDKEGIQELISNLSKDKGQWFLSSDNTSKGKARAGPWVRKFNIEFFFFLK